MFISHSTFISNLIKWVRVKQSSDKNRQIIYDIAVIYRCIKYGDWQKYATFPTFPNTLGPTATEQMQIVWTNDLGITERS